MTTNEIKELIALGRMEKAINETLNLLEGSELKNLIVAIKGSYYDLEQKKIEGIVSFDNDKIQTAEIISRTQKLLDLFDLHNLKQLKTLSAELNDELKVETSTTEMEETVAEVQKMVNDSENFDAIKDKREVKKESLTSFKEFLDKINNPESTINKTISKLKNGVSIAKKLALTYNNVAQWLGLAGVPVLFGM